MEGHEKVRAALDKLRAGTQAQIEGQVKPIVDRLNQVAEGLSDKLDDKTRDALTRVQKVAGEVETLGDQIRGYVDDQVADIKRMSDDNAALINALLEGMATPTTSEPNIVADGYQVARRDAEEEDDEALAAIESAENAGVMLDSYGDARVDGIFLARLHHQMHSIFAEVGELIAKTNILAAAGRTHSELEQLNFAIRAEVIDVLGRFGDEHGFNFEQEIAAERANLAEEARS